VSTLFCLVKVTLQVHERGACRFTSVEMFSVRQEAVCFLWLTKLKSYKRVRLKFSQVYPNLTAPIYRSVMSWKKCLKREEMSWNNMGRHAERCPRKISNAYTSISDELWQVCSPSKFNIRPNAPTVHNVSCKRLQTSDDPEENRQKL
jgi:hypothetical protein